MALRKALRPDSEGILATTRGEPPRRRASAQVPPLRAARAGSRVEYVIEAEKLGVDTVWSSEALNPAGATLTERLATIGRAMDVPRERPSMENQAKAIYALYAISVVFGVTAVVGVVLAYLARDDAPNWLASHYRFQIRTFWLLVLFSVIGVLLTMVLVGFLVLIATAIWLIVRCAKGWRHLDRLEPVENVETWLF